jgi:hypothetical protein
VAWPNIVLVLYFLLSGSHVPSQPVVA